MDFHHQEIEDLIINGSHDKDPLAFDQVMIKVEDIKKEPDVVNVSSDEERVGYSGSSRQRKIRKVQLEGSSSNERTSKELVDKVGAHPRNTQRFGPNSTVTLTNKGFASPKIPSPGRERRENIPINPASQNVLHLQKISRVQSEAGTFNSAFMNRKTKENKQIHEQIESSVLPEINFTKLNIQTERKPVLQKTPSGVVVLTGSRAINVPQKVGRSYNLGKRVQCPKCNEYVLKRCKRLHSRYYCGIVPDESEWKINSSLALCLLCNKCQEPDSIEFHVKYLCGKRQITVQCFYCPRLFSDYRGLTKHMRDSHNKRHRFNDLMSILPPADPVTSETAPVKVVKHFFNNRLCAEVESYLEEEGDPEFFCFFCSYKAAYPYEVLEHMEDSHGKQYNTYDVLQAQITGVLPVEKNAPELNQNSGFANYQLYEPRVILKHSHSGDKQEVKMEPREVSKRKKTDEASDDQKQIKTETISKSSIENRSSVDLSQIVQRKIRKLKVVCSKCSKVVFPDNMRIHRKYLCGKEPAKKEWVLEKNGKALCFKCKKLQKSSTIDFHVKYICNAIYYSVQCFYCTKIFSDYKSWLAHSKKLHNKSHYFQDLMTVLPDPEDANDDSVEYGSQSVVTHPFIYNPPTIFIDGNIEVAKFSSEDDFYSCFYCESHWKAAYKALDHMEDAHDKNHTMYDLLQAKMATPCQAIAGPPRTNKTNKKSIPSTSTVQQANLNILANNDPDYVYSDEFRDDLTKNSNVNQIALIENKTFKNKLTLKYRKNLHSVSSTFFTDKKKKKRTSIPEVLCKKCKKYIHPGDMRIHKKYHCGNETVKREWILKKGGKSMCLKCRKMVITRTVDFHVKYMCRVKPFSVQCFYCTKFCTDYRRWIAHIKMAHNKTHYFQDLLTILPEPERITDESLQNADLIQREVEHPFIYNPPSTRAESSSDFLKFSSDDDFFFCFYCGCKWTAGYKVLDHMEDAHNKLHNMYDLLEAKIRAAIENQDPETDTVEVEEEEVDTRKQTKTKQEINENNDYDVSSKMKSDKIEQPKNKLPIKILKKKVNIGSDIFNVQKKKKKRLSVVKITCLKCAEAIHPDHVRIHKKYHCGKEPVKKEWILYSGKALCLKCNKLLITNSIDFHCRYLCQMKTFSVQCFYCTKVFSEYRSLLAHMQKYHNKSHYVHDFMTFLPEPEPFNENPTADQRIITHPFIYSPPATVDNEEEDKSGVNTRFPSNEDFYTCFYCNCEWKAGYKLIDHMEEAHEKKHNLYDLLRAKMTASSDNLGICNIDKAGKSCSDAGDLSQALISVTKSSSEETIKVNEDKQSRSVAKGKEISNNVINIESEDEIIFDFPEALNTSKVVTEVSSDHMYHMNADKQNTKGRAKSKLPTDVSTPDIKQTSTQYVVREMSTSKTVDISSCQAAQDEFLEKNSGMQQTTPIVITVDCTEENDGDIEIIDIDMDETCEDKFRRFGGTANKSPDKRNEVEVIDLDNSDEKVLCSIGSVTDNKTVRQDDVIIDMTKDFHEDVESSNHKETSSKYNALEIKPLDTNLDQSIKIKNVFTVQHSLNRFEEAQFEINQSNDGSLNLNEEVEITFCNVKKDCQTATSNSTNQLNIKDFKESDEQQDKIIISSDDCMDQVEITNNYMDMEPSFEITNVTTLNEHAIMCEELNIAVSSITENNELVSQDIVYNNDSSIHNEQRLTTEYEIHADCQIPTLVCFQSPSVQNKENKTTEQDIVENCQVLSTDALVNKNHSLIKEDNITERIKDGCCRVLTTSPVHNSPVSEEDYTNEHDMNKNLHISSTITVHSLSVNNEDKGDDNDMNENLHISSTITVHSLSVNNEDKADDNDMDEKLQNPSTIKVHSPSVNNEDKGDDNDMNENLQIPSTISVHSLSVNNEDKADNDMDEYIQIPSTITVHSPSVNIEDKAANNDIDESLQIPSTSSITVHKENKPVEHRIDKSFTAEGEDSNP